MKYSGEIKLREGSASKLTFNVFADNGVTPITPDDVIIYLFVTNNFSGTPIYINGRNGTDNTGVSNSANAVTILLSSDDNVVHGAPYNHLGYEFHTLRVRIEKDSNYVYYDFLITVYE
jgi:hypothetical protein